MGDVVYEAHTAIYNRLNTASVTGLLEAGSSGIHWPSAPATRTWPYLLIECLDAAERDRTFEAATWTEQIWSITGVTVEDAPAASAIAYAVHQRLELAELTISGYRNLCCFRRRAKQPRPVIGEDGVLRFHAGAEYTIGVAI